MDSNKLKLRLDDISEVNPALTCYHREDPAPVLPLRDCLLYTSPSPRDRQKSRMPSSA